MASQLTLQQQTVLKAAILAAGGPILAAWNAGQSDVVRQLCNVDASGPVAVWRTDAQVNAILDGIDFTKYTPNDAPSIGASDTAAVAAGLLYLNRSMNSQIKQINLQLMLQGRATIDASKTLIRAALRDAVTSVPTGTGGVNSSPGGSNGATALAACLRNATFAESALKGANATTGATTAALLSFEGQITTADIDQLTTLA